MKGTPVLPRPVREGRAQNYQGCPFHFLPSIPRRPTFWLTQDSWGNCPHGPASWSASSWPARPTKQGLRTWLARVHHPVSWTSVLSWHLLLEVNVSRSPLCAGSLFLGSRPGSGPWWTDSWPGSPPCSFLACWYLPGLFSAPDAQSSLPLEISELWLRDFRLRPGKGLRAQITCLIP